MNHQTVVKFQIELTEKLEKRHESIWGGQAEFTALLPHYFRLLEVPNLRFEPSEELNVRDPLVGAAWWDGAIHLLAVGLGWSHLGKGLNAWRQLDYKLGLHPVLDFIWNQYSVSTQALEIWGVGQLDSHIANTTGIPYIQDFAGFPVELDQPLERMGETLGFDWRFSLAEPLIDMSGGSDNFHLTMHFPQEISGNDGQVDGSFEVKLESEKFQIDLDKYSSLLPAFRTIGKDYSGAFAGKNSPIADVRIKNFGDLGRFVYSAESKRWFLAGSSFPANTAENLQAHLLGN